MEKCYSCLCETGKQIVNECTLETLKEVVEFMLSLGNHRMCISDFESLIQIGKLERYVGKYRFLILVKDVA